MFSGDYSIVLEMTSFTKLISREWDSGCGGARIFTKGFIIYLINIRKKISPCIYGVIFQQRYPDEPPSAPLTPPWPFGVGLDHIESTVYKS